MVYAYLALAHNGQINVRRGDERHQSVIESP